MAWREFTVSTIRPVAQHSCYVLRERSRGFHHFTVQIRCRSFRIESDRNLKLAISAPSIRLRISLYLNYRLYAHTWGVIFCCRANLTWILVVYLESTSREREKWAPKKESTDTAKKSLMNIHFPLVIACHSFVNVDILCAYRFHDVHFGGDLFLFWK